MPKPLLRWVAALLLAFIGSFVAHGMAESLGCEGHRAAAGELLSLSPAPQDHSSHGDMGHEHGLPCGRLLCHAGCSGVILGSTPVAVAPPSGAVAAFPEGPTLRWPRQDAEPPTHPPRA